MVLGPHQLDDTRGRSVQAQKEKLRTARVKADEAAVDAALASRSREQQRAARSGHTSNSMAFDCTSDEVVRLRAAA